MRYPDATRTPGINYVLYRYMPKQYIIDADARPRRDPDATRTRPGRDPDAWDQLCTVCTLYEYYLDPRLSKYTPKQYIIDPDAIP